MVHGMPMFGHDEERRNEMIQLAQTDYYELAYDREKNRIHWKIKGYWPSVAAVPNFHADWGKAMAEISQGFTILADLREMKPAPPDVAELHQGKQQELMQQGCRKAVQVSTDAVTVMQINRVAKHSGMGAVLKAFDNLDDANAWLDEA
jgi:hypothetical protein